MSIICYVCDTYRHRKSLFIGGKPALSSERMLLEECDGWRQGELTGGKVTATVCVRACVRAGLQQCLMCGHEPQRDLHCGSQFNCQLPAPRQQQTEES